METTPHLSTSHISVHPNSVCLGDDVTLRIVYNRPIKKDDSSLFQCPYCHGSTPYVSGMSVLTVIATDADRGNNGSVTYSLKQVPMKGSTGLFSIDSSTGLILTTLNNALDRETQPEYTVIVKASDRGYPSQSCRLNNIDREC